MPGSLARWLLFFCCFTGAFIAVAGDPPPVENRRYSERELRNLVFLPSCGFLSDVDEINIYLGERTLEMDPLAEPANVNAVLRKAFRKKTGLAIAEEEAQGARLNLGMRGLNPNFSRNLSIQQDGFPLATDFAGYRAVYYIPEFSLTSQFQWAQAGAGIAFGSMHGGSLNFIGYPIPGDQRLRGGARSAFGSDNLFEEVAAAGGTIGGLGYAVQGRYGSGAGYQDGTGFEKYSGGIKLIRQLDDGIEVTLSYTKARVELDGIPYENQPGTPGGLTDRQFSTDPRQNPDAGDAQTINMDFVRMLVSVDPEDDLRLEWRTFYNGTGERSKRRVTPGVDRRLNQQIFNYGGTEVRGLWEFPSILAPENYLSFGGGVQGSGGSVRQHNEVANVTTRDLDRSELNFYSFLNQEFRFSERLRASAGVRLEWWDEQVEGRQGGAPWNRGVSGFVPLGSAGAEFDLVPAFTEFHHPATLYANVARTYRAPTYVEALQAAAPLDSNLGSSIGWHFESGIRGNPSRWLLYDLSGFFFEIDDQIGPDGNGVISNVGQTQHRGIELFAQVDLFGMADSLGNYPREDRPRVGPRGPETEVGLARFGSLALFSAVSWLDAEITQSPIAAAVGIRPPYAPEWTVRTGLEYNYFERIKLLVMGTYASDQLGDNTNSTFAFSTAEIPSYFVMDLSVEATLLRDCLTLFAGVNNMLNESYFAERRSNGVAGILPAPGRNVYGGFRLTF